MKDFPNIVRKARNAAGLTQKEVGEILGIPKRSYENWEYGKTEPPEYVQRLVVEALEMRRKPE